MSSRFTLRGLAYAGAVFTPLLLTSGSALACACGCGVFDVGTSSMFPNGEGGTDLLGFDFQDQTRNWSGGEFGARREQCRQGTPHPSSTRWASSTCSTAAWGVQIEIPYWNRYFATDQNFSNGPPDVVTNRWWGIGDIRHQGHLHRIFG